MCCFAQKILSPPNIVEKLVLLSVSKIFAERTQISPNSENVSDFHTQVVQEYFFPHKEMKRKACSTETLAASNRMLLIETSSDHIINEERQGIGFLRPLRYARLTARSSAHEKHYICTK